MTAPIRSVTPIASSAVTCTGARSVMEAFVDGELSPEQTLGLEGHLEDCVNCRASADFLRVLSATVKEVVHFPTTVPVVAKTTSTDLTHKNGAAHSNRADVSPAPFMTRLELALDAEIEREVAAEQPSRGAWLTKMAAFAAAASATLWFGVRTFGPEVSSFAGRQPSPDQGRSSGSMNAVRSGNSEDEVITLEGALDRLIDYHSSPPQPQVTSVDLLPVLEPDVGVRMQLPKLDAYGARWEGASLVPVRNQRAASFRYQLPKNRVTLYVFNASRMRVQDSQVLVRETPQPQPQPHPVYFGQWRGYNVAAKENRGVGYALATDMDGPAVARMIHDIH